LAYNSTNNNHRLTIALTSIALKIAIEAKKKALLKPFSVVVTFE
jgi:hypothetical protein